MAESYSPYIGAAGSGLEAFADIAQAIQAGKRAKAVANYNADVSEANAQAAAQAAEVESHQYLRQAELARQDQVLAQQANMYRTQRQREQQARIIGQTRAIMGASGLMLGGSPMAVLEETARQQELDILAGDYATKLQMRASGEQATQAEYASQMALYGGQERLRIGRQGAALSRAQGEDDYALAGLLKASGSLAKGAATYQYQRERLRNPSLLDT